MSSMFVSGFASAKDLLYSGRAPPSGDIHLISQWFMG